MKALLASLAVGLAIAASMFAVMAPSASAQTYGPATMLDVTSAAQFDTADSSVISANGRYVAFRGSVDGQFGIWRRDLQTGQLAPVAVNLPGVPQADWPWDPQAPSISADGRYIAFNTEAALDPNNDVVCGGAVQSGCRSPDTWQVYVRDMNAPTDEQPVYTLASAINGHAQSLTYSGGDGSRIAGSGGADAAVNQNFASPGGAISADGRTVVFSVDSESNLANPTSTSTPPFQVAVRNLDTQTTTLVSTCQQVAYCPTIGGPVSWSGNGVSGGAVSGDDAVISADGTTVAWLSDFGALQQETQTLTDEIAVYGGSTGDQQAVWRRIKQNSGAQIDSGASTFRITGAVDPFRQGCPPGAAVTNNHVPPACQGPLQPNVSAGASGSGYSHLALSSDGYRVALIAQAVLKGSQIAGQDQEGYLVDMHPGASPGSLAETRIQATTPLTQAGGLPEEGGAPPPTGEGSIVADAISADGNTVALTTPRVRFDLQNPFYLGPARANEATGDEVYVVDVHDRQNMTLDLATYAYNGTFDNYGFLGGGGYSPSLSSDGSLLTFDSTASNLVWGDGNGQSNVYVEQRLSAAGAGDPPPSQEPGAPLAPSGITPLWVMHATASSLSNGNVRLYVLVPGAGRIRVRVSARLPGSRGRRRVSRIVATANIIARGAGLTSGIVHLGHAYLKLARDNGGLRASARLTFTVSGTGGSLDDTIGVTFRAPPARAGHRAPPHRRPGRRRR